VLDDQRALTSPDIAAFRANLDAKPIGTHVAQLAEPREAVAGSVARISAHGRASAFPRHRICLDATVQGEARTTASQVDAAAKTMHQASQTLTDEIGTFIEGIRDLDDNGDRHAA